MSFRYFDERLGSMCVSEYKDLAKTIEYGFDTDLTIVSSRTRNAIKDAVDATLKLLENGHLRVANKSSETSWKVNIWTKKAILLAFKLNPSKFIEGSPSGWSDKFTSKFQGWKAADFEKAGLRVVPNCIVRHSAYIAPGVVLLPCFVNVGAYVDTGTMIDSYATVGSCAQIGKRTHISMGAGIGGVLEPQTALPTIIEDDCFIGANSVVAEGVIVGEGSVIAMGVSIGASTKIVNRTTGEISTGFIPPYSVVVSGMLADGVGDGIPSHSICCAVVVKQVDKRTRMRTSINELLR